MRTSEHAAVAGLSDPVERAAAADAAMWDVTEGGHELLEVRDAAVREALAAGRDPAEVAGRLHITERDVVRIGAGPRSGNSG